MLRIGLLFLALTLGACGRGVPDDARVVVAGDSVMAWNRVEGASVADGLSRALDVPVGDVSLPYASVSGVTGAGPLNIARQVGGLDAPWVVVNGGANDLGIGCGRANQGMLEALITPDGSKGAIPNLVRGLTARGSRVVWADYYTSPKFAGTACARLYADMEQRLGRMAAIMPAVLMVDMGDVIATSDPAMFDSDRIHPSPEGSRRIAALVAEAIRAADPTLR